MLEYENELYKQGITLIAGVDEVGRGPLVGPVVTAAVILPKGYFLEGINDSKKLTEKQRDKYSNISIKLKETQHKGFFGSLLILNKFSSKLLYNSLNFSQFFFSNSLLKKITE